MKELFYLLLFLKKDTSDGVMVSIIMAIHFDFDLHPGRRSPQVSLVDYTWQFGGHYKELITAMGKMNLISIPPLMWVGKVTSWEKPSLDKYLLISLTS